MKIQLLLLWGSIIMSITNISHATEVNIEVSGVDINRSGSIIVMIFTEDGFPKKHDKALLIQSDSELRETMEFEFDINIEEMAVKVLHDENNDGKVTKNWTGIYPKDGLGFSNEQKVSLSGAPIYKNSKLSKEEFEDGLTISILYP